MDESILNHLFLPHYLPSSADNDFLINPNHRNEHHIFDYLTEFLNRLQSTDEANTLPILQTLIDCVERWSVLQNPQNMSASKIQETIEQMPPGSFFPLYFLAQNAAILIEIDDQNTDQPLLSSWQVSLSTSEIVSSLAPHLSCFPVTTYRLQHRSQLSSRAQCELLVDFMDNDIEYPKSSKNSRTFSETREVTESHYVRQWWIQQFQGIIIENNSDTSIQFKKKHRDHIRWNTAFLPFRRSGLWMTIKVVFHTILTKRLGHVGTIVYKLLITYFLTYVMSKTYNKISIDLLVHCIRKIVRRLNKIESLLSSINPNDLNQWIQSTKQEIQIKLDRILPKPDWQNKMKEQEKKKIMKIEFELNHSELYQHLFQELNAYLNSQKSSGTPAPLPNIETSKDCAKINPAEGIPSFKILREKLNYTIAIALTRLEIWVEYCLEDWLNQPIVSQDKTNRFEILFQFFEDYQSAALDHYCSEKGPTDPIGYSRFILTSLTIIHSMQKNLCNDPRFERLKLHAIHIPNLFELFEFLVLPNRDDMIRAVELYNFFDQFMDKPYPDLLTNIGSADAFGVNYASQSSTMNDSIQKIRDQAELDKQEKIKEVETAKENYTRLMDSIKDLSCTCTYEYHGRGRRREQYLLRCDRCVILNKANDIKVNVYECPLPSKREGALAVIFELQMPIEIRIYRDILWQFINRPKPHPSCDKYKWLDVPPCSQKLTPFYVGRNNCKVKLVSSVMSMTQTHYRIPSIGSTPIDGFLFECALKTELSATKTISIVDECRRLTPQLDHPDYKELQIAINSTRFVQNHVIAKLSKCSARLNQTQFVEFGSFRSGHHLQWWNLLAVFEMDSLPLADESVVILITHSILQYGPLTTNQNEIFDFWCSESHEQLLEDGFVDEFIARLDCRLKDCQCNWQNELVLMIITIITMRIFTICDLTRSVRVAELVIKCRRVGEKWIEFISKSIQATSPSDFDVVIKLRLKMITVGLSCVLTFSTHQDRLDILLSSNEHIVSLLKSITTIRDNLILNMKQSNMSNFIQNMMAVTDRVLLMVQPRLAEHLEKTSYQSLNDFAAIYWAIIVTDGAMDGKWQKRIDDPYVGWYDCLYKSRRLSIDCLTGTFLVDEMTIGFLPAEFTTHELYLRVFDRHIFEVQPAELPKTYITKQSYHGDGRVQYEFYLNHQSKHLTIRERHIKTKDIFQLIPPFCLKNELADTFISNHSHWLNENDQTIEFRSVLFTKNDFLENISFRLLLTTGTMTTTEANNPQILINQSSTFFQSLFERYFSRLDDKPYIYMMRDNTSQVDTMISIHLTRLKITFHYNCRTKIITSQEYSDMSIDEDQWLGTLTGLTNVLLLSPLSVNNYEFGRYPYRKLIVPYGKVEGKRNKGTDHQTVTISRSSSTYEQYFVFTLNDRLRVLQSTDSPTGWLYLALLHAMTSHPLADEYTRMTGMERAFQLLNSAGCWSDEPFNEVCLCILNDIAAISPIVNYYPEHLTCMEKIDWNSNGLPHSMQHFGYYLMVRKIYDDSIRFIFMYPSLHLNRIPVLLKQKQQNEKLLKKLYWDYRDSYNPSVRLSAEMENDIVKTNLATPHQQTSKNYGDITNYPAVRLLDDLYANGDVGLTDCSDLNWLPLSQWLIKEGQMKALWIGLLQLADRYKREAAGNITDDIQRFECLLDFLHYISDKCAIKPYYLQMLKTTLHSSDISFMSITFPPFISYTNITHISIQETHIPRGKRCTSCQKNLVMIEVKRCWEEHCEYPKDDDITTSTEKADINKLLNSWRANRYLRLFLETVQNLICSIPIEQFHENVSYIPQQFAQELFKDHYQIQLHFSNDLIIDRILLSNAEQKFHHFNIDYFNKPILSNQTTDQQKKFPEELFSSINDQDNVLEEIEKYFRTHLTNSWKKFFSDKHDEKVCPSPKEIIHYLKSLRDQSTQFFDQLIQSLEFDYRQLFQIGLITRMTPFNMICLLNKSNSLSRRLTTDQYTLLGGIIVNWTLEQQMERSLHFANHQKWDDLKKDISHIPHSNWIPSENISWLILELEMNVTIREIQIRVANHMIKPNPMTNDSIVMQMNMGEGKTSVILPMLSVSLSSPNSSLVRIIVLKSLFPPNYQSLRYKLGGLLNRRIFAFVCRRDLDFTDQQIEQIHQRFRQALKNRDIILTSPEDILSFDLLTIDRCRRKEFNTASSMLNIQRWLKKFVRDVLDESDEILHVKYQLVYTIGGQKPLDGGAERWITIQSILKLVKNRAEFISASFPQEVCYKASERKSSFPQFRLQSDQSYLLLCRTIANDWINTRTYRYEDANIILEFILNPNASIEHLSDQFSECDIQLCLIVRGLLSSGILSVALRKRYRVNYGIDSNSSFNRLMAVPFRAKDIAADRTEFGHPDVALVLTHLTYYYSGLNDEQLLRCFNRLEEIEPDSAATYSQWISYDKIDEIDPSIQHWKGVNLKDHQQRIEYLFPTFRFHMLVVNYFLHYFVFPREAKQFPYKLVSSAWDLSSSLRSNIITGFSGTNDTQLLLPVHIRQYDLDELQKTDAIVVNNLLKTENEQYQSLPNNIPSNEILHQIVNYNETINVILDIGALFIDGTNQQIAIQWLDLSDKKKIDYAVYFHRDSIFVCDRQFNQNAFATSPASERLDRCVFYLDEIHTRGTDFKFPMGFKAALTLGNGLTKDRFVQASMRMRKLGHGHSLTFWSSCEVHEQIIKLKKNSFIHNQEKNLNYSIRVIDILRWVYENTKQLTWDGLNHWAAQSLNFQRKISAFQDVQWDDDQQSFTDKLMQKLAEDCLEPETIELRSMYGTGKIRQTLFEIYSARYKQSNHRLSTNIQEEVLKRLEEYGGTKQRFAQLLDEEQQKELEQELEAQRQIERPSSATPCLAILHKDIERLCDTDESMLELEQLPGVFRRLTYAFTSTTLFKDCPPNSWPEHFWISTEFQRVIETKGESLDPFLRPPRWVVFYRNEHLIFLSPLEANSLIGRLKILHRKQQSSNLPTTTIRLLLPRIKRNQSIFVNTPSLMIPPPRIEQAIPLDMLVQLFVFNGTLYFETVAEQTAYCQCLSLCPKPRTPKEQEAFEKGWINVDGFVNDPEHRVHLQLNQVRFYSNPPKFVKNLIETRNHSYPPMSSHIGSIILNSLKLIE